MDKIIVLDFGSQTTQLISRRVRELGVYCEILPGDAPLTPAALLGVKGLILSGSPESVYTDDAPVPDKALYTLSLPLLGICYGTQRLMQDEGGLVSPHVGREYGRARVRIKAADSILAGVPDGFISWMSHGDAIERLAPGYLILAETENGVPAVVRHRTRPVYGLQFHPEVTHTEHGLRILKNFALSIAGAAPEWNVAAYAKTLGEEVKLRVDGKKILLLISGGVDSAVTAALLLRALPPQQTHLMYVDTGLMRKGESAEVVESLQRLGAAHIHHVDAADRFLTALHGVRDPERKRSLIGDMFMLVQDSEVKKLGLDDAILAQGTLYTDLIESGRGVGKKAHVIKTHHNVRAPLVEEKRKRGLLIEPLASLYKDEVRSLGRALGLPESIVGRHPFPGPGLGVRILGDITPEKLEVLREADFIYLEELKRRGFYDKIWQAFSVLLPIRSVGVSGDMRRYGYVLSLRAVVSEDGMTCDVFPFPMKDLLEISARITNSVKDIGRVVYDISSKPPATIEWE